MKTYEKSLLDEFNKITIEKTFGENIEIKPIPFDDRLGVFDKREIEIAERRIASKSIPATTIEGIRRQTGFPNLNLNTVEIITDVFDLDYESSKFRVWEYVPRKPFDCKTRTAIIYVHGGSWFAGSVFASENYCRLLAEKCNAAVFNVDYSLSPEAAFPIAINQCKTALNYVYNNAENLGIDKNKIVLMGDSCGGNLVSALIANQNEIAISQCILFYPCVSFDIVESPFEWKESYYQISEEHRKYIIPRLVLGRGDGMGNMQLMQMILASYCQHDEYKNLKNPMLSPLYGDLKKFPKTLIITAEFDGLRLQAEYFYAQLKKQGISARAIRYRGVCHGFIDKLGVFPQVEDTANIIASELN